MKCTYKFEFPVDELGRPGGIYSITDLPIIHHKELSRNGKITGRDLELGLYKIKDKEGFTVIVPIKSVHPWEE